jgi:hypothetical protein
MAPGIALPGRVVLERKWFSPRAEQIRQAHWKDSEIKSCDQADRPGQLPDVRP